MESRYGGQVWRAGMERRYRVKVWSEGMEKRHGRQTAIYTGWTSWVKVVFS